MVNAQDRPPTPTPSVPHYRTLWLVLFAGWLFAYADRAITGPVVTWMIDNDVDFLQAAENPHALGGLIGSLFFAGYMLTQLPSGHLGDRYGHAAVLTVSFVWAGVATIVSGLFAGLFTFVALRVITGLGEGAFYSNDRSLVVTHTPEHKRSLGLGVAITGLAFGLTVANIAAPPLLNLGEDVLGRNDAWKLPFLVFGGLTLILSGFMWRFMRRLVQRPLRLRAPFGRLAAMAVVFCALIMALFWASDRLGIPEWLAAVAQIVLALAIVAVMQRRRGVQMASALRDRDTMLIYVAAISILWSIWLFGYWSVAIVSSAADSSLVEAGLTAAFNAGAGIIGFPVGGWLSDVAQRRGLGRRNLLIAATVGQGVLVLLFGLYLQFVGEPSLWVMGVLMFGTGLFLNAVQPMSQALTADLVRPENHGSAFGMWNLIAEIGAVASPVVSGALRDATGSWTTAIYLDAALVLGSAFLYLGVRRTGPLREDASVPSMAGGATA
ncbi:MFS transporter [Actinomadura sp. CNU-125]|uniref:MFS transporter n=1 Tax=Actinomadura sp. CNU-125 TaxID=1904961 RepID=UPI0009688C3D|nr:MFS transporter [Actinomadura sp. CNU-125]OLT31700.1 MFS transporter [Actinomadura sp. CNU-125]